MARISSCQINTQLLVKLGQILSISVLHDETLKLSAIGVFSVQLLSIRNSTSRAYVNTSEQSGINPRPRYSLFRRTSCSSCHSCDNRMTSALLVTLFLGGQGKRWSARRVEKQDNFTGRGRFSWIDTCVRLKCATGDSGFYEEISVETLCRAKWPLRFVPEIKTVARRPVAGTNQKKSTETGENKDQRKRAKENERKCGARKREERGEEEGWQTGDGPREDKLCNPLWSAS